MFLFIRFYLLLFDAFLSHFYLPQKLKIKYSLSHKKTAPAIAGAIFYISDYLSSFLREPDLYSFS